MSTNQNERPRFYEGQYLGAEDMTAAVECSRIQQARHALGGHTWGIAMGLDLREVPLPSGGDNVDVYIQPGYAWDGFGRPVVVLAPYKLQPEAFKDELDGLVKVWLQYDEMTTQAPEYGFEVCGAEDQNSRIQETFKVAIGDFSHSMQHDEITVSGKPGRIDALEVVLKTRGVLICDESVPFQTLPDGSAEDLSVCPDSSSSTSTQEAKMLARWLIPLGQVKWKKGSNGVPGYFAKLSDPKDIKLSRSLRQYVGIVAEGIYAADGVIRLRGREKSPPAQGSNSSVCEGDRLVVDKDRDLVYGNSKLSVTDLVWVEGNLRVKGDIKLFGSKLSFRNSDGSEDTAPLHINRVENNLQSGKDLRIELGASEDGKNRLAVGPIKNSSFVEKLVVQDDGKVGINTASPKNTLDVSGGAVIGGNYGGAKTAPANGLLVQGNVGIGTTSPEAMLEINGGDLLLKASAEDPGDIIFQNSAGTQKGRVWSNPAVGAALYLSSGDNTPDIAIDAGGNIGIGMTGPAARLDIAEGGVLIRHPFAGGVGGRALEIGNQGQAAANSPNGRIGFPGYGVRHGQMRWVPAGGAGGRFEFIDSSNGSPSGDYGGSPAFVGIRSQDGIFFGNVGIGTIGPAGKIDIDESQAQQGSRLKIGHTVAGHAHHIISYRDIVLNSNDGIYIRHNPIAGNPTSNVNLVRITPSGYVGIGTTSPTHLLHVNGSAAKPGGGSWTNSSDMRLKKNIEPLTDALSRLIRLRGVSFEWVEPEKQGNLIGRQIGLIAQEVEKVFPEWVGTDLDGYKDLTIRGFEALAVEAFRAIKEENEQLKAKIKELEKKIGNLAKRKA